MHIKHKIKLKIEPWRSPILKWQTEENNLVKETKGQLRKIGATSSLRKISRMSKIVIIMASNMY